MKKILSLALASLLVVPAFAEELTDLVSVSELGVSLPITINVADTDINGANSGAVYQFLSGKASKDYFYFVPGTTLLTVSKSAGNVVSIKRGTSVTAIPIEIVASNSPITLDNVANATIVNENLAPEATYTFTEEYKYFALLATSSQAAAPDFSITWNVSGTPDVPDTETLTSTITPAVYGLSGMNLGYGTYTATIDEVGYFYGGGYGSGFFNFVNGDNDKAVFKNTTGKKIKAITINSKNTSTYVGYIAFSEQTEVTENTPATYTINDNDDNAIHFGQRIDVSNQNYQYFGIYKTSEYFGITELIIEYEGDVIVVEKCATPDSSLENNSNVNVEDEIVFTSDTDGASVDYTWTAVKDGDQTLNGEGTGSFKFPKELAGYTVTFIVKATKEGMKDSDEAVFRYNVNVLVGVEGIEAENGVAEYYNLQGVRVDNPEKGMYIRVQNGKAQKFIVK